jgi:quercetin dioxygenase-like cupin family protein
MARLLLEGSAVESFGEGDTVRFSEGDVHGLENPGPESFVYLAVTSPPINFRSAYAPDATGSR